MQDPLVIMLKRSIRYV